MAMPVGSSRKRCVAGPPSHWQPACPSACPAIVYTSPAVIAMPVLGVAVGGDLLDPVVAGVGDVHVALRRRTPPASGRSARAWVAGPPSPAVGQRVPVPGVRGDVRGRRADLADPVVVGVGDVQVTRAVQRRRQRVVQFARRSPRRRRRRTRACPPPTRRSCRCRRRSSAGRTRCARCRRPPGPGCCSESAMYRSGLDHDHVRGRPAARWRRAAVAGGRPQSRSRCPRSCRCRRRPSTVPHWVPAAFGDSWTRLLTVSAKITSPAESTVMPAGLSSSALVLAGAVAVFPAVPGCAARDGVHVVRGHRLAPLVAAAAATSWIRLFAGVGDVQVPGRVERDPASALQVRGSSPGRHHPNCCPTVTQAARDRVSVPTVIGMPHCVFDVDRELQDPVVQESAIYSRPPSRTRCATGCASVRALRLHPSGSAIVYDVARRHRMPHCVPVAPATSWIRFPACRRCTCSRRCTSTPAGRSSADDAGGPPSPLSVRSPASV